MPRRGSRGGYDLVVLGEVLIELRSEVALRRAKHFSMSFSGDALNAAGAAAAAGAHVALLTRIGDDELGAALLDELDALGVDDRLVRRVGEPNGVYFTPAAPSGPSDFVYARRNSAAATLSPADVAAAELHRSRALLTTGVAQAIASSAAAAVVSAVKASCAAGRIVVHDPNFRARLTTPEAARDALRAVVPHATLVAPSCPADTLPLLGTDDALAGARELRRLGAPQVAVTCGDAGVLVCDRDGSRRYPAAPTGPVVDATGAGDAFAGTVAAHLALGSGLDAAVSHGLEAAASSLGAPGGTGWLRRDRTAEGGS